MTKTENPFIICIRTRKKYGLSLRNCLEIDCKTCEAYNKCPVKDIIRVKYND